MRWDVSAISPISSGKFVFYVLIYYPVGFNSNEVFFFHTIPSNPKPFFLPFFCPYHPLVRFQLDLLNYRFTPNPITINICQSPKGKLFHETYYA